MKVEEISEDVVRVEDVVDGVEAGDGRDSVSCYGCHGDQHPKLLSPAFATLPSSPTV